MDTTNQAGTEGKSAQRAGAQGKPKIQIKKSTLMRTAKYAGIGAGVLFLGYGGIHTDAGQMIILYAEAGINAVMEKFGVVLKIENPADTIEAKIDEVFNGVKEIFSTHGNQMRQGLYNDLMIDKIEKQYVETEAMFLQYAKGTEVARYVKEVMNPERLTTLLDAYGKNAPKGEVIETIVAYETTLETYLGTILSKEEQEAHYLEMTLLVIGKGWLTDIGYGTLIREAAAKASPETVAEAVKDYLITPEARKIVLDAVGRGMKQEEKTQAAEGYLASLPQDQYDAEVLRLTARVSTDGYAQIEKQVDNKKWDERFEKGKQAMDVVKEYIKR